MAVVFTCKYSIWGVDAENWKSKVILGCIHCLHEILCQERNGERRGGKGREVEKETGQRVIWRIHKDNASSSEPPLPFRTDFRNQQRHNMK